MIIQPSTSIIRDVSNSLKALLAQYIPDLKENNISFDSPGDFNPPAVTSLTQFLIQLIIDPHARNNPFGAAELEEGGYSINQFRNPPVTVDLIYMLTPFSSTATAKMELLEKIITVLNDHPVLKDDLLKGSLAQQGNKEIRIIPVEYSMDVIYNIWSIFPNKSFKLSLFYKLSPIRILSSKIQAYSRVETKKVDIYKITS